MDDFFTPGINMLEVVSKLDFNQNRGKKRKRDNDTEPRGCESESVLPPTKRRKIEVLEDEIEGLKLQVKILKKVKNPENKKIMKSLFDTISYICLEKKRDEILSLYKEKRKEIKVETLERFKQLRESTTQKFELEKEHVEKIRNKYIPYALL